MSKLSIEIDETNVFSEESGERMGEGIPIFDSIDSLNDKPDESSLESFDKLTEENMDKFIDDVKDYIYLFLFKGEWSSLDKNIENLFDLSPDELNILKSVYFIMSPQVEKLINILPQLLRNLSHSTSKEKTEYHGIVRGRIDWNDTLKTRYSKGFNDPSLFVCTPSSKVYDLEENQLLKFLLNEIIFLKENYIDFIPDSDNNEDSEESEKKYDIKKDWYTLIFKKYKFCKKALNKVYFKDITDIHKVKSKHIRKALKNRNFLYHYVADAYILFEKLFIDEDEDTLKKFVNEIVIKAADPNKLYELYAFIFLIRALKNKALKNKDSENGIKLYLLRKRREKESSLSVCYNDNGVKIRVYYQFTPTEFSKVSQYIKITKHYSLNASIRSPDLMIEFEKDGEIFYRIVEVKNTSKGDYIRSSIYKVMGYYKDFEDVKYTDKCNFTEYYPIVLLTMKGIKAKKDYDIFNEKGIIILNRDEFIDGLENLISLKKVEK